jgi:hypothetical protein
MKPATTASNRHTEEELKLLEPYLTINSDGSLTFRGDESRVVRIVYRNYRGEVGERKIFPLKMEFLSNEEWYSRPQWIVVALDLSKMAVRSFAVANILDWQGA